MRLSITSITINLNLGQVAIPYNGAKSQPQLLIHVQQHVQWTPNLLEAYYDNVLHDHDS